MSVVRRRHHHNHRTAISDAKVHPVTPDPLVLDLLRVADAKIEGLNDELKSYKQQLHAANESVKQLQGMVSSREVCVSVLFIHYLARDWQIK